MSHEGRMSRGETNFKSNKLLDNEDTKYYLEHREVKEEIKSKEKKKNVKSNK